MPFEIVRNDITNMRVDAIVNTANPEPIVGSGTDSMVHAKAGPELLEARKQIGSIERGEAAITPAFGLDAKYVIHTVGPSWIDGAHGEADTLRKCYDNSMKLAVEYGCESIAFPLMATGNYRFPKDQALQIAIAAFSSFLLEHDLQIYLVVFNEQAFQLSEKLFRNISSFIDREYAEYHDEMARQSTAEYRRTHPAPSEEQNVMLQSGRDLASILKEADVGFSEYLLQLINQSKYKNADIYKRANLTKQHFSKILNNTSYRPTKSTALALAIALELDLEQTKELIGRAGYALTNSSKFDLIVRYHIEKRMFDVVNINIMLYEFDQPLLGARDC